MPSTKIRHQFLLDPDMSARLNALAQDPSTTKTDLIAKAIKVFIERGTDSELVQVTAKRLDVLSRELGAVRHDLDAARRDLDRVKSDVTTTLESLVVFIRFCMTMSGNVAKPDKDKQAIGQERWRWLVDEVGRRIAEKEKPSRSPETIRENHE